jgi:predicted CXXCH cytochrome family protein
MSSQKRYIYTLFPFALLMLLFQGCANTGSVHRGNAQSESCRSCHSPDGAAGAKDFSSIYNNPKSHHPVGVKYPIGSEANQKFKLPNRQTTDIAFFDRNSNGQPDNDEIQLFGMYGEVTVECASCHKKHGSGLPAAGDTYLRVDNAGSALCTTCHLE